MIGVVVISHTCIKLVYFDKSLHHIHRAIQGMSQTASLELVTHPRQAVQNKETMTDISIHKGKFSGSFDLYATVQLLKGIHMYTNMKNIFRATS